MARAGLALGAVLFLTGCLHHRRAKAPLPPTGIQGVQRVQKQDGMHGMASWYGRPYNGRPTSSGEIYNMYAMTAAHRTLPFGTMVRVHDLDNGRTVVVRINDRGPFVAGRIIDLSYAAAESMGMVGPGTARVRLEILNPDLVYGPTAVPGVYSVQVGAFEQESNAERMKASITPHFGPVLIQTYKSPTQGLLYRVLVGRLTSQETANELADDLKQARLVAETYVVRLN